MTTYLGHLVMFLSTLVAIRGKPWNASARGVRRLTLTGRITGLLALAGLLVAVATTRESNAAAAANRKLLEEISLTMKTYQVELLQVAKHEGATAPLVKKIEDFPPIHLLGTSHGSFFDKGRPDLPPSAIAELRNSFESLNKTTINPQTQRLAIIVHSDSTPHFSSGSELDRMLPTILLTKSISQISSASNIELAYVRALGLKFEVERMISERYPSLQELEIECFAGAPLAKALVEIRLAPKQPNGR